MDLPKPTTTQTNTTNHAQNAAETTTALEREQDPSITDGWDPTPRDLGIPQGMGERAREQRDAVTPGHIALQGGDVQPPQPVS